MYEIHIRIIDDRAQNGYQVGSTSPLMPNFSRGLIVQRTSFKKLSVFSVPHPFLSFSQTNTSHCLHTIVSHTGDNWYVVWL